MQKILFSDHVKIDDKIASLTDKVISGDKIMTRRKIKSGKKCNSVEIAGLRPPERCIFGDNFIRLEQVAYDKDGHDLGTIHPRFQSNEVVAVAQNYGVVLTEIHEMEDKGIRLTKRQQRVKDDILKKDKDDPGWTNKMFVSPEDMLHRIIIIGVRHERLQEISEVDCIREGISLYEPTPKSAFMHLINGLGDGNDWEENYYVWIYLFKHLKD